MEEEAKSTYVLNENSTVELARLIDLDRLVTEAMGGPLSGTKGLLPESKVLDLACGPGGWVLDVAFAREDIEVAGVDISQQMIDYAYARKRTQHLDNASFGVMDITAPLDFSDNTFDLVNARFLVGVLKRGAWFPFLKECTRILKPGGTLRLTEPIELAGRTTSDAYNEIVLLMIRGMWESGYGFHRVGMSLGMDLLLPSEMRAMGYQGVRLKASLLDFSEDQLSAWGDLKRQLEAGSELAPAFLERVGLVKPGDMVPRYQQALIEMHQTGFRGTWPLFTVLGEKPQG